MTFRTRGPGRNWKLVALLGLGAVFTAGLGLLPLGGAEPAAPPGAAPAATGIKALSRGLRSKHLAKAQVGETIYGIVDLEFRTPDDCQGFVAGAKGAPYHVFSHYAQFADVMVKLEDEALNALDKDASRHKLRFFDPAGKISVPPPPPPFKPLAAKGPTPPEPIVHGGIGPLTGKGVIIAVVDSGIDFRHPDFITTVDGKPTSRLLCFWDTERPYDGKVGTAGPVTYPDGQAIGTVFSRDDLSRDLRGEIKLDEIGDDDGHGTCCAGVAAGSGRAAGKDRPGRDYRGVAPGADLIAVRVGQGERMNNAYLLNAACGWLDKVAAGRPLVVSCSFGQPAIFPDGNFVAERQLSARFGDRSPGRLICVAAGNEGGESIHAEVTINPREPALLSWDLKVAATLKIYVPGARPGEIDAKPAGSTQVGFNPENDQDVHGPNGVLRMFLDVPKGRGGLYLSTKGQKTFHAHAYLPSWQQLGMVNAARFTGAIVSNAYLIGSPGAARGVITVGSYDFNDLFDTKDGLVSVPDLSGKPLVLGALSYYSCPGYVVAGTSPVVKPDVVAPGEWFTAPLSAAVPPQPFPFHNTAGKSYDGRDSTGKYQLHNGTSAATPYVAGVAALMLEKDPKLTTEDFRKLLADNLTKDEKLAARYPNPNWGYGKLDFAAVKRMAGVR